MSASSSRWTTSSAPWRRAGRSSRRPGRAAAAHRHRGRFPEGVLRRDAAAFRAAVRIRPSGAFPNVGGTPPELKRGARHQAGHGLREQPCRRAADPSRDDRAARLDDGRAAGGHGRALHHRGPHRRGVGRIGEAPRPRRRVDAGDASARASRRGAISMRSAACGRFAACASGAPTRTIAAPSDVKCSRARTRPITRLHLGARGGRRSRHRRARDVGARAGRSERMGGDGAHVCAIGACRPDQREMDSALVARARLFVDSRKPRPRGSGRRAARDEGRASSDHMPGNWASWPPPSSKAVASPDEVTIFKSLGMAVEDIAAAHLAYVKAAERGLGRGFVI